uniref:PHB domain-containing protein n=1 Tax=Rhabditophanes sp. KR3021 TaxID=114890 RepID=A0AC35TMW2_9BILA
MRESDDRKPFLPTYRHSRPHYMTQDEKSSPETSKQPARPLYRGKIEDKTEPKSSSSSSSPKAIRYQTDKHVKKRHKRTPTSSTTSQHKLGKDVQKSSIGSNKRGSGNVSFKDVKYDLAILLEQSNSEDEEGSNTSEDKTAENSKLMDSDEEDAGSQHDGTANLSSNIPLAKHPRLQKRRFTLNPMIFAKEESNARRHSLAQLKLSYYPTNANADIYNTGHGFCGWILMALSIFFTVLFAPITIIFCLKIAQEYERAVIFRLGRLCGAKGPGIFFVLPCIETYTKIDLRTISYVIPPQEIISKDSVTISVDAVVYYKISNAIVSIANITNCHQSTRLLAQVTLRTMLGTRTLSEILAQREDIGQVDLNDFFLLKNVLVEIKDVRLPVSLQRSMASEAEATRHSRAKIISADGEKLASKALREAADEMAKSPVAIQLRYLQTLSNIA